MRIVPLPADPRIRKVSNQDPLHPTVVYMTTDDRVFLSARKALSHQRLITFENVVVCNDSQCEVRRAST